MADTKPKTDVHSRAKAAKSRLLAVAQAERVLNDEIQQQASGIADRASNVGHHLRKRHEADGSDVNMDTAYQSVLLSRQIANTVLGSARELRRKVDSVDGGNNGGQSK